MLKNKVIGTFVAVWFAVCLSYGGLRAAFATMLGASIAPAQAMTASWENSDTASQPVVVVEREATVDATEAAKELVEEPTEQQVEAAAEEAAEEPVEEQVEAPEEESAEEPTIEESPAEEDSWYEEEEAWEAEAEVEEAYVPSLEEYLSQFTCGSCRRNCSLANPHCFNGSQLADAKAQEYYSMF